jgi:hypothetical protein
LAGSAPFIAEARRYKHMFAGAMRQGGRLRRRVCLHALDHHVERLVVDTLERSPSRGRACGDPGHCGDHAATARPTWWFFEVVNAGLSNAEFVDEMLQRRRCGWGSCADRFVRSRISTLASNGHRACDPRGAGEINEIRSTRQGWRRRLQYVQLDTESLLHMKPVNSSAVALIAAAGLAPHVAFAQQAALKRIDLSRHDMSIHRREALQVIVEFAPGQRLPGTRTPAKKSSMSSKATWSTKSPAR